MFKRPESDVSEDADLRSKHSQRIRDYLRDALDHSDPLRAILRASSSDLNDLSRRLKDAIDQSLAEEPDLRKAFEDIAPLLEVYLKFQRQFDRCVQLDQRIQQMS